MANNGLNMNTLLIVGGSAVALYFLKDIFKSSADAKAAKGDIVETRQENRTDRVEIRNETWRELINGIFGNKSGDNTPPPSYSNAGTVSAANPVTNITSSGAAYNMRVDTITTAKGSSNIIAAPNTYYQNLGVGFDSKGQGYSSAFAGGKPPAQAVLTKGNYYTL